MKVLAQVSVSYHPVFGLSVNVKDIDPSFSLGERARVRQETIDRLTRDGLIRLNSQLPLPKVIQRIAVISSATAAGYGDFVNQLEQNPYGYRIYHRLFNSLMQGNEAVTSLLAALETVESENVQGKFDAVVIIRGGGAQLDLDCFDDYRLAAQIAKFPLPIFTGIGHERDETIADLVAHTRLKTPTAVAEFLLSGFREFEENLGLALQRIDRATRSKLREEEQRIHQVAIRVRSLAIQKLSLENEKVNTYFKRIEQSSKSISRYATFQLEAIEKNLTKAFDRFVKKQDEKLHHLEVVIKQLDPHGLLLKGYTRTESNGTPIHLIDLKAGDELITYTSDQKLTSTLTKIEKK
jgi:exodeoxyribonuclease VII large subunit